MIKRRTGTSIFSPERADPKVSPAEDRKCILFLLVNQNTNPIWCAARDVEEAVMRVEAADRKVRAIAHEYFAAVSILKTTPSEKASKRMNAALEAHAAANKEYGDAIKARNAAEYVYIDVLNAHAAYETARG